MSNILSNQWRIGLEMELIDVMIFTWKRGCSGDSLLINLVSRRGRLTVYSRVNWKNSVHGLWRLNSWFLTKTDRKKCKNTHNILLDGCYLLFEQYLLENTSVYILKPYQETSQSLEESLWGGKLVNPLNPKIKIWILICCPYSFPTEVVGRGW